MPESPGRRDILDNILTIVRSSMSAAFVTASNVHQRSRDGLLDNRSRDGLLDNRSRDGLVDNRSRDGLLDNRSSNCYALIGPGGHVRGLSLVLAMSIVCRPQGYVHSLVSANCPCHMYTVNLTTNSLN